MKIKKGDKVRVMIGKSKGAEGAVLKAFPKDGTVLVEGANMVKKHIKAKSNIPGQILNRATPISISKVALLDPATNKPTRVGYRMVGDKKIRVSTKSGNEI